MSAQSSDGPTVPSLCFRQRYFQQGRQAGEWCTVLAGGPALQG